MKTIVFINTNKSGSSREAIRAAQRLGYYTVLLTDKSGYLEKRTEFYDIHLVLLCDLSDTQALREIIKEKIATGLDIEAIVSFVDPYCSVACMLAQEFGVNKLSTDAIMKMENKMLSREAIKDSKHCPEYSVFTNSALPSKEKVDSRLPFIIKSPSSTGSKDVIKIDSYDKFIKSFKNLRMKYPGKEVIVEEYLDGPQYLVETTVFNGEVKIITVIKQEILEGKRFIITGYNMLQKPGRLFMIKLKSAVEAIIKDHGMTSGACHLELRYVKKQWKLIEINPRISGAGMNNMIMYCYGINLVEETLKYILDMEYDLEPKKRKPCFAQYVTVDKTGVLEKVTGKNRAIQSAGVLEVYVKPRRGTILKPPTSMGQRYAYVIATGASERKAKINAKKAAGEIEFLLNERTDKE